MLARRLNTERQGLKSLWLWFFTLSAAFMILAADVLSAAQTYEFSINVRRLGNQVGAEIWVKSLTSDAPKLGNCTYSINYRSDFLNPADPSEYVYYQTDSIITDVNHAGTSSIPNYPYQEITSPFHNDNGYSAIQVNGGSDYPDGSGYGYAELEIRFTGNASTQGFQPATTGKGSFLGMIVFDIADYTNLSDTSTVGFAHNTRAYPTITINDVDNNSYSVSDLSFDDPTATTIEGITVLNPKGPYEAVDRDAQYLSLPVAGYPVYFERSGLLNTSSYSYGTPYLAYVMTYSMDGGTSWSNVMRFAETGDSIKASEYDNYASGELETRFGGVPGYIVTQANGDPLTSGGTGYGGIVRVIWNDDASFSGRSEEAKIRITQLSTSGSGADIDSRSTGTVYGQSASTFDLSRFFFVQLNGSDEYLRTKGNYSNATQLTVEAWVNLNQAGTAGAEPGIVASSGGPSSPEEGAWILYLKDGQYPAFKARTEGWPTESGVPFYIDSLESSTALPVVSSNFDLTNDTQSENHRKNWVHLAATVKNDSITLYVNGQIVAQKSNQIVNNIRMKTTNHPIWIGVNPNISIDATDYFDGGIKEVKVWRIALNADQIIEHAAGVYDPTGAISAISEVDTDNDVRLGLELYYPLAANLIDEASNQFIQNGEQELDFYKTGSVDNSQINYRPDKAHIRLISPSGGEGISNLEDATYTVKWIGYGLGSVSPNSDDLFIEFSRDGGTTWEFATDNSSSPAGVYLDTVEIESGSAVWEPYNNVAVSGQYNDLQGVGNTIDENYVKEVYLRVGGTTDNGQTDIYDMSGKFYVAPHFALANNGGGIIYIPGTTTLNLTSNVTYIEAWVAPYRFPTTSEGFFPIVSKLDSSSGIGHYSFRLLSTGQLQLQVTESDGSVVTATSDATRPIAEPNTEELDTTWYHVGVMVNLANGTGVSNVRFYIDGVPQTADSITTALGSAVSVDVANKYPTYLGYEPGSSQSIAFVGQIKEVRFWNGYPAGMETGSTESTASPSDATKFIQGALTVRAANLSTSPTNYQENLVAAFSMDGGSFVNNGLANSIASTSSNIQAYIRGSIGLNGSGISYEPTYPYVKVVEPIFRQQVSNTTTDLRVRWVGFDYDPQGFTVGDASDSADLDFSILGGGGLTIKPWTPVSSVNYNAAYTDAMTLKTTDKFLFSGVTTAVQYGAELNVSISNPDINGDHTYNDQGVIPPALTNARLRLRGRATINSASAYEYTDISSLMKSGPLFDITPPSNFTVRVLLEGFHSGSDQAITDIGDSYSNLGLKISLFDEVAGKPGSKVDSSESTEGYYSSASALDPTESPTRGTDGSTFANVPFVFTSLYDGNYYVVVEHLNHLPVMSRFTAPFQFDGDDLSTWEIESGWDFQSWGQNSTPSTSNYMSSSTDDIYSGNGLFSAYGEHEFSQGNGSYDKTGLIFNQGRETTETNRMASMVAGDVYRDGQINALDRIQVRSDNGSNVARSDVTGDGQVNGEDRDIVDRNGDKLSSLIDLSVINYVNGKKVETPLFAYMNRNEKPFEEISDVNPDRAMRMNEAGKVFAKDGKHYEPRVYNGKKVNKVQASNYDYEVIAEPFLTDDIVTVTLYLKNNGADFAPGNCTFAFTYESDKLEYIYDDYVAGTEENPFTNNQVKGYDMVFSTPDLHAENPLANVRTIDIDYDGYTRPKGVLCPHNKTKLGTLKFKVMNKSDEYKFNWHKLSVLLTVDGTDITDDGDWVEIEPINITRKAIVMQPNGGERWSAGRLYTIEWTKPTVTGLVYLEYSIDNGASWTRITDNPVDIVNQDYHWSTPRINSTECLVRLVDATTGKTVDMSDNTFSLVPIGAEIIRPALTDGIYHGGQSDFIKWLIDDATNVVFEFSEDGQSSWQVVSTIVNSDLEKVSWILPDVNTKNARVRMIDKETGEILAVSQKFLVLAGNLSITNPSNGSKLNVGDNTTIRWTSARVDNFDLLFSPDGGQTWQSLSKDVNANTGGESWVVPKINTDNAIISAVYNNDIEMQYSRVQFSIQGAIGVNDGANSAYSFEDPTPNPFFGETSLEFTLPFNETVTITVMNSVGQKVAIPVNSVEYSAGTHILSFRDNDLAAGVYYFQINAGVFTRTRRVVKMK